MNNDLRTDDALAEPEAWDVLWRKYFNEYQGDCRHAYYIASVRRRKERNILEIGAGSFRDMAILNRWGFSCEGVDFSTESVRKARELLPALSDRIKKMDAVCLDYPDKAFDLTYHNGFWSYFDDARISELAAGQARVTRLRMIATVHNAHNQAYKERFVSLAKRDPLYRIRFFYANEITSLMRHFCRNVTVLPVNGGITDRLVGLGLGLNTARWMHRLYGRYQSLDKFERLMCIGEMAE